MTQEQIENTIKGILVILDAMCGELIASDCDTADNLAKLRDIIQARCEEIDPEVRMQ